MATIGEPRMLEVRIILSKLGDRLLDGQSGG